MAEVSILSYTSTNKDSLIEIMRLNTPEYFHEDELSEFDAYLENELEDYFVALIDDNVVGCGGINYDKELNAAIIAWDMIHPKYQGQGIGATLTKHRLNKIKEDPNNKHIVVRTSQFTFKFYEKMGFTLIDINKNYWAEGIDKYEMFISLI